MVLIIQHVMHMRRIVFLSVACLTVSYFPTLSYKRYDFKENINLKKKFCFDFEFSSKNILRASSHFKKN